MLNVNFIYFKIINKSKKLKKIRMITTWQISEIKIMWAIFNINFKLTVILNYYCNYFLNDKKLNKKNWKSIEN